MSSAKEKSVHKWYDYFTNTYLVVYACPCSFLICSCLRVFPFFTLNMFCYFVKFSLVKSRSGNISNRKRDIRDIRRTHAYDKAQIFSIQLCCSKLFIILNERKCFILLFYTVFIWFEHDQALPFCSTRSTLYLLKFCFCGDKSVVVEVS